MPQIYDTPQGPALLVSTEDRGSGAEYKLAVVSPEHRCISLIWRTELPDEYVLINDPGARAETVLITLENSALIREKALLLECLQTALGMLDERSAEQVRDIYRTKIKSADVVSLSRPSDIVGITKGE